MAFSQAPVNYAVEYARELAKAYPYLSYFNEIWNGPNSNKYKPVNGKTVMVPSMTTSGARAVDRDHIDGTFSRNWNNEFQPLTMRMDREWDRKLLMEIKKTCKLMHQELYSLVEICLKQVKCKLEHRQRMTASIILHIHLFSPEREQGYHALLVCNLIQAALKWYWS